MAVRKQFHHAYPIPLDEPQVTLRLDEKQLTLTNLQKEFWPKLHIRKGDLLQYYLDVSPQLLPHLIDRPLVMKRYPDGAEGSFFFMKNAPDPHPVWLQTCSISHGSGNIIHFPVVRDLASLLWIINLGCIDLNQWYARCDDINRPDYLHFDLDPVPGATFAKVRETALIVQEGLVALGMQPLAKTSGSKGIHIYVPIVRGPKQKQVWRFAKDFALALAAQCPRLITAEYRVSQRPAGHVLVDYNQNAWGRTLASVYSVRPTAAATVSMPVDVEELEEGVEIEDFTIFNVPRLLSGKQDFWAPLLDPHNRFPLEKLVMK